MKLSRRLIIIFCFSFFLLAIPVSIAVPIVLMQKEKRFNADFGTVVGWDNQPVQEMINNKQSFVLFFGNTECGACKRATEVLAKAFNSESDDLQATLQAAKTANATKPIFYWYYDTAPLVSEKIRKVREKLNSDIIGSAKGKSVKAPFDQFNFQTSTIQEVRGTPVILFFQKGELVGQILGNIPDLTTKLKAGIKAVWNLDQLNS